MLRYLRNGIGEPGTGGMIPVANASIGTTFPPEKRGMALGLAIPLLVTAFAGMPTVVTPWSLVLSFGISVGVGIGFGIYPAMRASKLDPIIALRYE